MPKKLKAPHRPDTRNGRWVGIPRCVIASEAYRCLDPMAKCALISLMLRFDGWNNGRIVVSFRQFAHDQNRRNMAWVAPAIA